MKKLKNIFKNSFIHIPIPLFHVVSFSLGIKVNLSKPVHKKSKLLNSNNIYFSMQEKITTVTAMTLAYIVEEKDNDVIEAGDTIIKTIVIVS